MVSEGNIFGLSDAEMAGWTCPICGYLNGFFGSTCAGARRGWKTPLRLVPAGRLWLRIYGLARCSGKPVRSQDEQEKVDAFGHALAAWATASSKGVDVEGA